MKNKNTFRWIIGSLILLAIGFAVIPPLINKISTKLYRISLKNEEIDIENLGPEIIKKEEEEE